jgi:hypothetical protein
MSATPNRRTPGAVVLDCVAIGLLLAIGAAGFGPAFGGTGYAVAAGGGILLGIAIALLGARFRWNIVIVSAATIVAYLAFGAALAVPTTTLARVVPTFDSIRALVLGVVFSWKDVLTLETPVGGFPSTLVVPFLSSLVATVFAACFALRLRRGFAWALLPAAALLVTAIAFGTHESVAPLVHGVAFAAVAMAWWGWRRRAARDAASAATESSRPDAASAARLRGTRIATGAALLVVAVLVGGVTVAAAAPGTPRQVLRDAVQPPLDLRQYASPLAGFRKYVGDERDDVLFTVTGLPQDARIRLATLDEYNGIVYDVAGDGSSGSGTFTRVSEQIPTSAQPADAQGTPATVGVTVGDLTGVWLPDVGSLDTLQFSGQNASALADSLHYNQATGTAITTDGLSSGDAYTMNVTIPPTHNDEQLANTPIESLTMPKSTGVPEAITSLATAFAGDADQPFGQVRNIATSLSQSGYFSHGLEGEATSRAGHGAERIATFLSGDQMVGDDEQYAVTMALMVRALGMPARVVMGFYPDQYGAANSAQQITGNDLHAWVEVPFQGAGWVPFDPTPPKDHVPQQQAPKPKSDPKAQVLQPPPPPQQPAELPPDIRTDDADQDPIVQGDGVLGIVLLASGGFVALLVILLGPVILITALKLMRRRRRQSAGPPADRLSGGWDEIVDRAGDLGTPTPLGLTRRETAAVIAAAYPAVAVADAATRADTGVFGPGEPSADEVDAYWSEVDEVVKTMNGSRSAWQRFRARISLRSFAARSAAARAEHRAERRRRSGTAS